MSRQFDAAVDVALEIGRELRLLTPDRPSLRCFIAECLSRADATYEEVEAVKGALGGEAFRISVGLRGFYEVPVHPPSSTGERFVEYLLRQGAEAEAKAA